MLTIFLNPNYLKDLCFSEHFGQQVEDKV